LTGDVSDQSRNKEVFDIAHENVVKCVKRNGYAVLDSTNVSSFVRENTIAKLKAIIPNLKTVALVFKCNPEVSKKRIQKDIQLNKDRANVPEEVIDRQYDQLITGISDIPKQFDIVKKINESKIRLADIVEQKLRPVKYKIP